MTKLQIEKSDAVKIFKTAPEYFKQVLISTFGATTFNGKIIDRIKSFEDACDEAGLDPGDLFTASDTPDEIAYKKLKLIAQVLREGWEPNWNDSKEYKWFPWFKWSSGSGFAFSGSLCSCANTLTGVGSRLCFPSEELANYFGKQFIEIHNELLIIKK
jgi:hypothetical protein